MYEELFAAAGESGTKGGAWEDQLPEDERDLLQPFEDWLVSGLDPAGVKAPATAKAYRGYVAQAMVRLRTGETWKELTTDVRSAVNAFIRFSNALKELEIAGIESD